MTLICHHRDIIENAARSLCVKIRIAIGVKKN